MTFTEFKARLKKHRGYVCINTAKSFVGGVSKKQAALYVENCHLNGHAPKAWWTDAQTLWLDFPVSGEPVTP